MKYNYLFYDERNEDCAKVADYLNEQGIAFIKVPCFGLAEPQLSLENNVFTLNGLNMIKQGVEAKLAREELGSRN